MLGWAELIGLARKGLLGLDWWRTVAKRGSSCANPVYGATRRHLQGGGGSIECLEDCSSARLLQGPCRSVLGD